ncbi:hypothetical protein HN832_03430 [archaeon]|jgi:hypothetical protein|nr:hypothetical protein [archaeon]MBT4373552.1 hypothetical protein [archaeon]MBT4532000.1 hypothetical protein [archaeon]MBT7001667.1 hypothetical protein [archaeon]MBT7282441.1 hypothetical protein [archaeon]
MKKLEIINLILTMGLIAFLFSRLVLKSQGNLDAIIAVVALVLALLVFLMPKSIIKN